MAAKPMVSEIVADEDVPMSDMSYVSAGIEGLNTYHNHQAPEGIDTLETIQHFISLPDNTIKDVSPEFNIAPVRSLKRSLLKRVLPSEPVRPSEPEQTHPGTSVEPEAEDRSANACSDQLVLDEIVNPLDDVNICILPLRHEVNMSKDAGSRTATPHNVHRSTDFIVSDHEKSACNENDLCDSTLVEHERHNSEIHSENEHSFREDHVPEQLTTIVTTTESGELVQTAVRSSQDTHEYSSSEQSASAPMKTKQHDSSVLTRIREQHKVTKRRTRSRSSERESTGHQPDQEDTARVQNTPSEEDLLLLLMHRFRQRTEAVSRDSTKFSLLREENKGLQAAKAELEEKLHTIVVERDSLSEAIDTAQMELDQFRKKYTKLKTWALEMNNEYADIREEGSKLKNSIASIRQQGNELRKPLHDALTLNDNALIALADIRRSFTETQQSVQSYNLEVHKTQIAADKEKEELRALRATELRQRLYIQDLCKTQKTFDNRTTSQQVQLIKTLDNVKGKLEMLSTQNLRLRDTDECLQLVRVLSQNCTSSNENINAIQTTVANLFQRFDTFQRGIDGTMQTVCNNDISDTILNQVSSIKTAMEAIKPNLTKIQELQQLNARLQEKVSGDLVVRELINEAKQTAETRYSEVQRNNDKLVDSIAAARISGEEGWKSMLDDTKLQLDQVVLEREKHAKELGEARKQAKSYADEVNDLKKLLDDGKVQNARIELEMQASYELKVLEMERSAMLKDRESFEAFNKELIGKDRLIQASKDCLQHVKGYVQSARREITSLRRSKVELRQSLEEMQQESITRFARLKHQAVMNTQLMNDYNEARKLVAELPGMKSHIAEKQQNIEELQKEVKSLYEIRAERDSSLAQYNSQKVLITELERKLNETELCTRTKLEQRESQHRIELIALQKQLADAQNKLVALKELQASVERKDSDISQLRSRLEDLENTNDKLKSLETEKTILEKRVATFEEENRSLKEQILEFEKSERDKSLSIHDLQNQVAHNEQLEVDFDRMCKELQEKEELNTNQRKVIDSLKSQQEKALDRCSNDNFDKFFTQNTTLSISTPAVADDQQDDLLVQVLGLGIPTSIIEPLVVDPRSIMHSNPCVLPGVTTLVSQTSIIPDSQCDQHAELLNGERASTSKASNSRQRTSSPLSEVNEQYLANIEGYDADSEHAKVQGDPNPPPNDDGDDVFDLPTVSPQYPARHRISGPLSRKPSSVLSLDEMLLQASESGRQASPRNSDGRHEQSRTRRVASRPPKADNQYGQSHTGSHHAHHQEDNHQVQRDKKTVADTENIQPELPGVFREPNRPNSAVKRRVDHDPATEINGRSSGKRLKPLTTSTRYNITHNSERSVAAPEGSRNSGLHASTSQSGASTVENVPGVKKPVRKAKATRNRSKQDRYAERFGDVDPS